MPARLPLRLPLTPLAPFLGICISADFACASYNFAASLQFIICISGVLFTTFILMFINTVPDTVIFRCAANFNFIMVYPYLIFYSCYLLAAQLFAIIFINSDFVWAIVTCSISFVIFHVLFSHWIFAQKDAFPNTTMHFLPTMVVLSFNPYVATFLFGKKYADLQQICKHNANAMIQVYVPTPCAP